MTNYTSSSLNFSVIGSDTDEATKIKNAFHEVQIMLSLHAVYKQVDKTLTNDLQNGPVDFIAMDTASFNLLEEKKMSIASPIILFSDSYRESSLNFVYGFTGIPVNIQKLEGLLKRFMNIRELLSVKGGHNHPQTLKQSAAKTFMIKRGKEFYLVNSDDVPAFYTDKKITFAFDKAGKKFMIHLTLIELENLLNPEIFFRANRQYLINRNYINKIRQIDELKFEIILAAGDPIAVDMNQQKFSKFKIWIESNVL